MSGKSDRPLLTVIIPTIGRLSLIRAVQSIRTQADEKRIEILVVGDTHGDDYALQLASVQRILGVYDCRYEELDAGTHSYGHAQCNYALERATGRWLAFLGDDDEWTHFAFMAIQRETHEQDLATERLPLLFKARMKWGAVLWQNRALQMGGISGQNIVVPNDQAKLGRWATDQYCGDHAFISSTIAKYGRAAWREDIIAVCH